MVDVESLAKAMLNPIFLFRRCDSLNSDSTKYIPAMKAFLTLLAVCLVCPQLQAKDEFEPLFNGKDLSGWVCGRGKLAGEFGQFTFNADENALHVYEGVTAGSKQPTNFLYSEKEYSHFVLKLEYKWLENRFRPRIDHDRDAGVLFHAYDEFDKTWLKCLEMQLGESAIDKIKDRYVTGDLWVIGKDLQLHTPRDDKNFYSPDVDVITVGKNKDYDSSFTTIHAEKPRGKWNEITVAVKDSKEAIFELNGQVVNRITDMSYAPDGKRVPLAKGRIAFQAEYAEMPYRNVRVKELPSLSGSAQ